MEGEKALERNWSSLPPELLNLIAKDLREVPDFIRFRAVCTAWRFSTPLIDLPPQFPWIIHSWRIRYDTNLRFYSLSSDKFYTIPDLNYTDTWPYEISQGYLLAEHHDRSQNTTQLYLRNPLNNDEVSLPAYIGYPQCFRQRYNQIEDYGLCCALSPQYSEPELICCRLGQNQWSELKLDDKYKNYYHFYLKGMLFSLHEHTGVTMVTDISTSSVAYVLPPVGDQYRVQSSILLEASGDIMGIFALHYKPAGSWTEVHRLHVTESGSPCWVKVKNIGNRALFMDATGVFILEANDLAGIKANCIYYLYKKVRETQTPFFEVMRTDIQTGAKEYRRCPVIFSGRVGWFVPKLCHLQAQ